MAAARAGGALARFSAQAGEEGLTVRWIVARERIDPAFAARVSPSRAGAAPARLLAPADLHPAYRRAILLGSGGGRFWERFRRDGSGAAAEADPLDRYTEQRVARLLAILREDDPSAAAVYPFAHLHQLLPFRGLTAGLPFLSSAPFGVTLDPEHGPWFAWRAAILTAAEYPESEFPAAAPCAACPAPCVAACPADAVHRAGFRWEPCADYRLSQAPCRETCLAREACPAGAASRYPRDEIHFHSRASLARIRQARAG